MRVFVFVFVFVCVSLSRTLSFLSLSLSSSCSVIVFVLGLVLCLVESSFTPSVTSAIILNLCQVLICMRVADWSSTEKDGKSNKKTQRDADGAHKKIWPRKSYAANTRVAVEQKKKSFPVSDADADKNEDTRRTSMNAFNVDASTSWFGARRVPTQRVTIRSNKKEKEHLKVYSHGFLLPRLQAPLARTVIDGLTVIRSLDTVSRCDSLFDNRKEISHETVDARPSLDPSLKTGVNRQSGSDSRVSMRASTAGRERPPTFSSDMHTMIMAEYQDLRNCEHLTLQETAAALRETVRRDLAARQTRGRTRERASSKGFCQRVFGEQEAPPRACVLIGEMEEEERGRGLVEFIQFKESPQFLLASYATRKTLLAGFVARGGRLETGAFQCNRAVSQEPSGKSPSQLENSVLWEYDFVRARGARAEKLLEVRRQERAFWQKHKTDYTFGKGKLAHLDLEAWHYPYAYIRGRQIKRQDSTTQSLNFLPLHESIHTSRDAGNIHAQTHAVRGNLHATSLPTQRSPKCPGALISPLPLSHSLHDGSDEGAFKIGQPNTSQERNAHSSVPREEEGVASRDRIARLEENTSRSSKRDTLFSSPRENEVLPGTGSHGPSQAREASEESEGMWQLGLGQEEEEERRKKGGDMASLPASPSLTTFESPGSEGWALRGGGVANKMFGKAAFKIRMVRQKTCAQKRKYIDI